MCKAIILYTKVFACFSISSSLLGFYVFFQYNKARPRGYETFIMLNSTEHVIYPVKKC